MHERFTSIVVKRILWNMYSILGRIARSQAQLLCVCIIFQSIARFYYFIVYYINQQSVSPCHYFYGISFNSINAKKYTPTLYYTADTDIHKHIFIWYYLIYKQIFVTAKRAERSWAAISRNVIFTLYKLDGGFDPLSIYSCNNRSLCIIIVIPHFFPQTISKRFFCHSYFCCCFLLFLYSVCLDLFAI